MLSSPSPRFLPRSSETTAQARRLAAIRAAFADLTAQVETLQKEHEDFKKDQDIQFRRIAQIQLDIDEIKRILKQLVHK